MNYTASVPVAVAFAVIAILAGIDAGSDLWNGAQPTWIDLTVIAGTTLAAALYGWRHVQERRLGAEIRRRVIAAIAAEPDDWAENEAILVPREVPARTPTYRN